MLKRVGTYSRKDMEVFLQGLEVMLSVAKEFPNLKILDLKKRIKIPPVASCIYTDLLSTVFPFDVITPSIK